MSLEVEVRTRLGSFDLDMRLAAREDEVVALLGPNGAGKTTLLRAIAGLAPIDSGHIELDGQVLEDAATGRYVPTEDRSVGFVFQDYLLFPHLNVIDNVAFGLRSRGVDRAEARRRAAAWLERVGLKTRAQARPSELSGGERQRVALARALAPDPHLLLLDEPLAALDATTRAEVRRDLKEHLSSFNGVRVLVTHDPLEAAILADRLVVMEAGRHVQTGTPVEVTEHPRSKYV
ncbi:MAG TPA: ATP-binding cassette domain-containing protein, partial [Candidatus Dormibacteraeota bacterium]|nr:ATP-binding cassette domain-containing protein [Candidatus Dormibacteraeota bacterium]